LIKFHLSSSIPIKPDLFIANEAPYQKEKITSSRGVMNMKEWKLSRTEHLTDRFKCSMIHIR